MLFVLNYTCSVYAEGKIVLFFYFFILCHWNLIIFTFLHPFFWLWFNGLLSSLIVPLWWSFSEVTILFIYFFYSVSCSIIAIRKLQPSVQISTEWVLMRVGIWACRCFVDVDVSYFFLCKGFPLPFVLLWSLKSACNTDMNRFMSIYWFVYHRSEHSVTITMATALHLIFDLTVFPLPANRFILWEQMLAWPF